MEGKRLRTAMIIAVEAEVEAKFQAADISYGIVYDKI